MKREKRIFAVLALLLAMVLTTGNLEAASKVNARITNTYFTHDAYHDHNKGFYLYYSFVVNGLQYKQVKCVVTLYRPNGSKIYHTNGSQATTTWYGNPAYASTTYTNNWSFFPYNLNLPYGWTNNCYAIIRIYNGSTNKLLCTSSKLYFNYNRA